MRRLTSAVALFFLVSSAYALNPAQCTFFEDDGKVTVCHATGSPKNPYVILRVSLEACLQSHTDHADDFMSVGDPSCSGLGCLPEAAPCDGTLPCCDGSACMNGTCVSVSPSIVPDHGPRGTTFTIADPQGGIQPGSVVLFYKLGQDPATDGVNADGIVIGADGKTLTGNVPNGALDGETFVSIRPGRAAAPYFDDLRFLVE